MATPAFDRRVRDRARHFRDLDAVMEVMDAAFGDRFGEAWTRSQSPEYCRWPECR